MEKNMLKMILNLARWDMIKLRRRWMPWVFLTFIVLNSQLWLWDTYGRYRNVDVGRVEIRTGSSNAEDVYPKIDISCLDIREGTVQSRLSGVQGEYRKVASQEIESLKERCPQILENYDLALQFFHNDAILPGSLSFGRVTLTVLGCLFVMVLAAMTMGFEYTWGTARQMLAKGCGRSTFLVVKILSIMTVIAIGYLVVMLGTGASSLVISYALTDTEISSDPVQWLKVGIYFLQTMYAMLPYVMLGMFFAILTTSASSGIAISVVFFLVDVTLRQVIAGILGPDAARILISVSVSMWMGDADLPELNDPSSIYNYLMFYMSASLPILAYIVVFGGASLWLFHRRDMSPSKSN